MPKNRLYINHPEIVTFSGTELSDDVAAAATTGSVLNNADIASDNILLFGAYGKEETELVTCTAIAGNTEVKFSAVKFAHTKGTILTKVEYDQYVLERSDGGTEGGTYSAINTASLAVDEVNNMYVDNTTWSNAWYKYRYYDSVLNTYSNYSDAFQLEYKENSLHDVRKHVKRLAQTSDSDDIIDDEINWYQRKLCGQYNWPFMETTAVDSAVADQVAYDQPSDCREVNAIRITRGTNYYWPKVRSWPDFKELQRNISSQALPGYWTKYGQEIWFHHPFSALGTENITVFYSKHPARLDSDNDITPLPIADALANRVAYALCLTSNPAKAAELLSDYQGAMNELKAVYGVDQGEAFSQVGYGPDEISEIVEIDTD